MSEYYTIDSANRAILLDPATHEALRPMECPPSIENDFSLHDGLEYLRQHGGSIRAGLLLTEHTDASSLAKSGVDLRAEALDLAQDQGILFIESLTTQETQAKHMRFLNMVSHAAPVNEEHIKNVVTNEPSISPFIKSVLQQIVGTGVDVLMPDYVSGSQAGPDMVLEAWYKEIIELGQKISIYSADYGKMLDELNTIATGFTNYRDWFMVAKIGAALKQMQPQEATLQHCKILVGANHANIGNILESMDIHTSHEGYDTSVITEDSNALARGAAAGVIAQNERIRALTRARANN